MTTQVAGYVSKTDMVTALIRELLMTGELGPGEQLRQRDLAQRFGVGQTPVREAMRRLESEGPLGCDTHRGFTVVVADLGRVAGYEYAHSPLLLSLMRLLWASLHGGPRVSRTNAESARQHDQILAALAGGDAGASARTYQHIMGADPVKEVSG
jgi:DNA-binding GntR family transcriptional regulator